jgi:aldehyde:ferredoxin oxidoreductase
LGPHSKLILAPGRFTGAGVRCVSRMAVMGKSPLTGAADIAPSGSEFPTEMNLAAWDTVLIEGRAEKPSYVAVMGRKVSFRHAANR